MIYKVGSVIELLWPVDIHVPKGDGTRDSEVYPVKIKYKHLSRQGADEAEKAVILSDFEKDYSEFIIGWEGVHDNEGRPFEFTRENLDVAMSDTWFYDSIHEGFRDQQQAGGSKN